MQQLPTDNDEQNILLIAASMRIMGGQAVMAQRLIEDLRRDGKCIDFLPVDPLLPRLVRPLERIKYVRTLVRSLFYLFSLLRRVPKCDLVHVFSASYASFLISPAPAMLVARLFGKPIVLNYRSGEAEDHLCRSGRITKWLLRLADIIVVPSGYLVSVFKQFGFEAVAIANHVDTSMIAYRERRTIQPRIIVARALEPLYNISCALRAARLVQDKYPQTEIVILGDGSERNMLERLSEELRLTSITFLGRVERSDITRLYQEAEIFLNTSSIDNMPVSIIEAFASGLPIVTTDAGGIPYMITDRANGHLVKLNDHEAVARRIIELVNDPAQAIAITRAGLEETKKYSWDAVSPLWSALYKRLLLAHSNSNRSTQELW